MKRAALVLFVLAPVFGEVLVGSTPPLAFLNPVAALYLLGLYGSAAVLVREVARGRGLGWRGIVLLGAAYGLLEEGLVVNSLLNPKWPDLVFLHGAAYVAGVNWIWTVAFAGYHAVISIAIPIVVAEAIFPRIARERWLGTLGIWLMAVLLFLASLTGLLLFGFLAFRNLGYPHPSASWFLILAIAVALVGLGLRMKDPRATDPAVKAPGPWRLRLFGFVLLIVWFAAVYVVPGKAPAGIVSVAAIALVEAAGWYLVARWSRAESWGDKDRLALATGAAGFFIALDPVIEFGAQSTGKPVAGMTLVGLSTLVLLIWLARRKPAAVAPADPVQPALPA